MSRHSTPASARARRIAIAPISIAVTPANRPNGCKPTPMMATSATSIPVSSLVCALGDGCSADRAKREGHDFVPVLVGAVRHDHELHLHAVLQPIGTGLRETRLH